jgi:hypothetical protein
MSDASNTTPPPTAGSGTPAVIQPALRSLSVPGNLGMHIFDTWMEALEAWLIAKKKQRYRDKWISEGRMAALIELSNWADRLKMEAPEGNTEAEK